MYGEKSGVCPVSDLTVVSHSMAFYKIYLFLQIQVDPPEEICTRIWCIKPGDPPSCTTRTSMSALYGTPCGHHKVPFPVHFSTTDL